MIHTRFWQIKKTLDSINLYELGRLLTDVLHAGLDEDTYRERIAEVLGMTIEERPEFPRYPRAVPVRDQITAWFADGQATRKVKFSLISAVTDEQRSAIMAVEGVTTKPMYVWGIYAALLTQEDCKRIADMPFVETLQLQEVFSVA